MPIALAGLSGVLCERAAVINIAIEGMMLSGAFMAALMTCDKNNNDNVVKFIAEARSMDEALALLEE